METGSTASPTISAALGGTALTQIGLTGGTSRQETVWLGYATEAKIGSSAKALTVTYSGATSNATGLHVKWATFQGVDQVAPVSSFSTNRAGSTTVTFGTAVSYVKGGMTTVVAGNGGAAATGTLTTTPAFTADTATQTNGHTSRTFVTAKHTAASNYASTTSLGWTGTTSLWSALVAASLQP